MVVVAHIVRVELAVDDITLIFAREMPLLIESHLQALIVEEVVHAASRKVKHLRNKPVDDVSASGTDRAHRRVRGHESQICTRLSWVHGARKSWNGPDSGRVPCRWHHSQPK